MTDVWILSFAAAVPFITLLVVALTYQRLGFYWAAIPIVFAIYFLVSESAALGQHNYQYGPVPAKIDLYALFGRTAPPGDSPCTQTSLGVPVSVVLMEALLLFGMLRTTDFLSPPQWLRPGMDGLMAVTIDLILDPVVANSLWCSDGTGSSLHAGLGLWVWFTSLANPGQWLGIPLVNFAAWFFGAVAISAAVRIVASIMDVGNQTMAQQFISATGALVICLVLGLTMEAASFAFMGRLLDGDSISAIQRWLVICSIFGFVAWSIVKSDSRFHHDADFHWEIIALPAFLFGYMGCALMLDGPWDDWPQLILIYLVCAALFASYASAPYVRSLWRRYRRTGAV